MNKFEEFLDGFAISAEIGRDEADEQWAGFSRQLSDGERNRIEGSGFEAGLEEGDKFLAAYGGGTVPA